MKTPSHLRLSIVRAAAHAVALVVALLATPGLHAQTNLISNGDFSAPTTNGSVPTSWTKDFNSYGIYSGSATMTPHSGSYLLHAGDNSTTGGVYQNIATTANRTYLATLWLQGWANVGGDSLNRQQGALVVGGASGNSSVTLGSSLLQTTAATTVAMSNATVTNFMAIGAGATGSSPWYQQATSFTASGSTTRVGVYNVSTASFKSAANVDDVGVYAANDWNTNSDGNWSTGSNWADSSAPNATGAVAAFSGVATAPRTITLDSNATVGALIFNNANAYTISGANSLTLSGNFVSGNASGSFMGPVITVNSGNHSINTSIAVSGALDPLFAINQGTQLTVGGGISGSTGLVKSGFGTLTLTGNNTYSGATAINAGTLEVAGSGRLGGGSYSANISNSGTFLYNSTNSQTLSGVMSGIGALTKNGTGTLTLSSNNTYTGTTTINAGTLEIGSAGRLGGSSYAGAITNNATLIYSGTNAQTLSGAITGTGALTHNASSTLTLSGANNYNGTTTINAGTLTLSGNLTTAGVVNVNGAANPVLNITGNLTSSNANGARALSIATTAGNTGTVNVSGSGVLNLTGGGMMLGDNNGGNATFNQTGGTVTLAGYTTWMSGANSTMNISGGNFSTGSNAFYIAGNTGANSVSTLTVNGTGIARLGSLQVGHGTTGAGAISTINIGDGTVGGGELVLGGLNYGSANVTQTINFNGGTFTANANSMTINSSYTSVVKSGGAIFNVNPTFTLTVSGNLTNGGGGGGLTKNGTGTLTLSGAGNNYTGTTTVNAGTLTLGANQNLGAIAGAGALNLANYTFTSNASSNTTYSGVISGTGGALTKNGTGTLTLSGTNTYTGGTTINAGTIEIGGAGQLGSGSYSGNIANSGLLIYSGTNNQTLSGIISGNGALTHNNTSTLTLSGNNTYSGTTIISTGTLQIGTGGTSGALNANSTITNNGTLAFNRSNTITQGTDFANSITGTGNLTKSGSNTLVLGTNTYSGATTVNGGTLQLSGNISSSALTLNSGGVISVGTNSSLTTVNKVNASSLTLSGGSGYAFTIGNISGGTVGTAGTDYDQLTTTGAITFNNTVANPFTVYLNGTPTNWSSSGSYTWNILSGASLSGFSSGNFIADTSAFGASLASGASFTFGTSGGNLTLTYGTAGTPVWAGGTGVWSGNFTPSLSNNLPILFTGAGGTATNDIGNATLSAVGAITFNSTAGAYTLAANAGSAGNGTALAVNGDITNNSASLQTINTAMSFGANRTITAVGNITIGGAISGSGSLTKNGTGTLTLAGTRTATGNLTINAGNVTVSSSSAFTNTIVNTGGTLIHSGGFFNNTTSFTLNGGAYTGGGFNEIGAIVLNNGTMSITGSYVRADGGWTMNGNNTITTSGVGYINIDNGGSSRINGVFDVQSGTTTINGTIAQGGNGVNAVGFTKNGSGTLVLMGANTWGAGTGNAKLNAGTLVLNNNTALGNNTFTINGGTLDVTSGTNITLTNNNTQSWNGDFAFLGTNGSLNMGTGAVTMNASRTVTVSNGTFTVGGAIGGATFGLTKNGSGTLILSGASTYNGTTTVNAGNLTIGAADRIADTSNLNVAGGTFDLGGFNETLGSITGSGNITLGAGTLTTNSTSNTTFSGLISGTGGLTKNGTSTLTLSGNNTYNGTTTISTGTIEIAAAGRFGAGNYTGNISNSGTLIHSGTSNQILGGILSGTGSLTQNAASTLTLSGANTYNGTTTIKSGTLVIGHATGLGSGGNISFTGGGLQYGSGITTDISSRIKNSTLAILVDTNGNNVTFASAVDSTNAGGFTKNGTGILTLGGNNTYAGNTRINTGTIEIGAAGRLGAGNYTGNIANNGVLIYSGTNNQTLGGVISGTGALTHNASSTLTLTGNNTYNGATTVSAGTLVLNGNSSASAVTIASGATLKGSGSAGATTVSGTIAPGNSPGTLTVGSLTLNGGGVYTWEMADATGVAGTGWDRIASTGLLTVNSTSGSTFTIAITSSGAPSNWNYQTSNQSWDIITYGSLSGFDATKFSINATAFAGSTANGSSWTLTDTGSALRLSYSILTDPIWAAGAADWSTGFSPAITNGANATFTGAGGTATNDIVSGSLSSIDSITFNSTAGAYTLAANSGSSGYDAASALQLNGNIVNNSTATQTINLALTSSASRVFNAASGNLVLGGPLAGVGGLTKNGSNKLTLSGNNTYSGDTTINAGTLEIASSGLLGGGSYSGNIVNTGAFLIGSNSNQTLSGVISGIGALTKNGTGTLTLAGNNNFSGGTTLNTGTLVIGNAAAAGTGTITQANGSSLLKIDTTGTITNDMSVYNVLASQSATLSGAITVNNATWDIDTGDTLTISGAVSGNGGVTKNGGGTLTLNGTNTYNGSTVVNAGTLNANSTNALGSNNTVQVNGGSLLVTADDAINGKNIELGGSGVGLQFSGTYSGAIGNLTLSANSIIDLGAGSVQILFQGLNNSSNHTLSFYNWSGTTLWNGGNGTTDTDKVYFGPDLSDEALAKIYFYSGPGDSFLGSGFDLGLKATGFTPAMGYQIIPVPEPETYATGLLLLLGGAWWMWRNRKLEAGGRKA